MADLKATLASITGMSRTEQELAFGGFPLLGDDKYGIDKGAQLLDALGHKRLCLHARTLVFPHPDTGKTLSITAPLDEDFEAILAALRGNQ